jgi:phosphoribosylamine--glycine ligase
MGVNRRRSDLKVLIIGSGAREHTIVWKLARSPRVDRVYASPGNAGTAQIATNLDIKLTDFDAVARAVKENCIELIIVGPENPLAEGIVDYFQKIGIPIFGPTKSAAQLESSKAFSKELLQTYSIPCARSRTFTDMASAKDYIHEKDAPLVIKADGLAAGKGVIMAETETEAIQALSTVMETKAFGSAGDKVVIEEKLSGKEISYFAVTDGNSILPLVPACDYKRVNDSDQGLNTGGMGSYSPPYFYTPSLERKVLNSIIEPTVRAMEKSGRPYQGVLFAGLMVDLGSARQEPKLLEYNVRFGDPECQVILPRLKSDLMDIILGVINGNLESVRPEWSDDACVGVVMASGGYPGSYKTGLPILGLDKLDKDIIVFQAGTKTGNNSGEVLTNGGRVLTVVALGKTTDEAREKIYANIPRIHFEGAHYRKDIAKF